MTDGAEWFWALPTGIAIVSALFLIYEAVVYFFRRKKDGGADP